MRIVDRAREAGADRPQAWTRESGPGRVFACIPGHFDWPHDDPRYRILVLRGIAWAAGQDFRRFRDLVILRASVVEDRPTVLAGHQARIYRPGSIAADLLGRLFGP